MSTVNPSTTRSRWRRWGRMAANEPTATVMLAFLIAIGVLALLAPWIAPYDPTAQDLSKIRNGPSGGHWLGTDDLGRDVLSRLMFGARVSLTAALIAVAAAIVIALPLGLVSAYCGGRIDSLLMRVLDIQLALPGLVLIIAVASALGGGLTSTMIALSFAFVPGLARVVRGDALAVKEETFIEASRSIGSSPLRILFTRVLRNVAPPLVVQSAITCGQAMGYEAALSFIGLGAQAPAASWGTVLRQAYDSIFIAPWAVVVPALLITLTAWAFNSVGDALSEIFESQGRSTRRGFQVVTSSEAPAATGEVRSNPLEVRGLSVEVEERGVRTRLTSDVSISVAAGTVVGVVGESGSGKSVTALSIARLFASPPAVISTGEVHIAGKDVLAMNSSQLRSMRGSDVAMVFQNPKASLNPAERVGKQIVEGIRLHSDLSPAEAKERAMELLEQVGVPGARFSAYPHQLSGGMCQRVMLAMAVACKPPLLIADEPTSALDVTVQADILNLLHDLTADGMSMVLITHDFGVIADICDEVLVMYAGEVVERGPVAQVLTAPAHPYTKALMSAHPGHAVPGERLRAIEGQVPSPRDLPSHCRFADRCAFAMPECRSGPISLDAWVRGPREARCLRVDQLMPELVETPMERREIDAR